MKCIISITVALVLTGVAIPSDAFALSCADLTLARRYELADNVFTAIVTDETVESRDGYSVVHWKIDITESFKGSQPFGALVSSRDGLGFDIDLDTGVEYLVFAPDSGSLGLCQGLTRASWAESSLLALRAFRSGTNPDLSEPWFFSTRPQSCELSVSFEQDEVRYSVGSLQFLHSKQAELAGDSTELRVRVGLFGIEREGAHNPLHLILDGVSYVLAWSAARERELVVADGTSRMIRDPAAFALRGTPVREILARLEDVDSVSLYFDASGFAPDINARVGTTNLRNGASEMLSCIRLN